MQTDAMVHAIQEHQTPHAPRVLIGQGQAFQHLLEHARLVAQADCRVLLIGEHGTGKEALARHIHHNSSRQRHPFLTLNCAQFRPHTSQQPLQLWNQEELSNASSDQKVPIDLTHGGTLYLHEVGALTSDAQTWLLRSLLTIEMESLNRHHTDEQDQIRIIAGTARNLQKDVADHRFRADLFYRLNVVPLHIPPLRERLEDIEDLASHFVRMYSGKYGKTIERISDKTFDVLKNYHWPRNIEEMEHLIERMIIRSKGRILHIEQIVHDPTKSLFYSYN